MTEPQERFDSLLEWWHRRLDAHTRRIVVALGSALVAVVLLIGVFLSFQGPEQAPATSPGVQNPSPTTVATSAVTLGDSSPTTSSIATSGDAVAVAGDDLDIGIADIVTLDASRSSDPDGEILRYVWQQTSGPDVTGGSGLLTGVAPSFTAPDMVTTLTFGLRVDDGSLSEADEVVVQVMEDPGRALFVDVVSGSDDGASGSRNDPFGSLPTAIAFAAGTGSDVYLAGDAALNGSLELPPGISLYGGYGAGWRRDTSLPSRLELEGSLTVLVGNDRVTLSGLDILASVGAGRVAGLFAARCCDGPARGALRLEDVTITTRDADAGIVNVAIAGQEFDTLQLVRVTAAVGAGGSGAAGSPASTVVQDAILPGQAASGPDGGAGGVSHDGFDAPAGGAGGSALGSAGVGGGGPYGGSGGLEGTDGEPGGGGPGGAGGSGGTGGVTGDEDLVLATGGPGGPGAPGAPGLPGGGGGGGGGVFGLAGGGGGGAGGAGGAGPAGSGGAGGGGSVGVALLDVKHVFVRDSDIRAGSGGVGGSGSPGLPGGQGSDAGSGSAGECALLGCQSARAGGGGGGGGGGAGGTGGFGGGGAGGPSIGILLVEGVDDLTVSGSRVSAGRGGDGGPGGTPGADGAPGSSGDGRNGGAAGTGVAAATGGIGSGGQGGHSYGVFDGVGLVGAAMRILDSAIDAGAAGIGADGGSDGVSAVTNF